jgi:hypothetical protein
MSPNTHIRYLPQLITLESTGQKYYMTELGLWTQEELTRHIEAVERGLYSGREKLPPNNKNALEGSYEGHGGKI